MAQRKPYNPNTAYGRRKLREQAQQHYDNLPPDEKREWDLWKFIIVLVICVIMFLLLGTNGFLKWATR
jgi:nitrate reductase NapE component